MIVLKSLLSHLSRAEVSEVVLQSGSKPTVRVDGALDEIGDRPIAADDLVHALFSAGGSRYVESLGPKPTQWRTRVEGVGAVIVSATLRGDVIEARFVMRDTVPNAPVQRPRSSASPSSRGSRVSRAPRADVTPSRRKRQTDHQADAPRAHADAPPRREEDEADTPPPAAVLAPHIPRDRLPTLPSEEEIDLEIRPSQIPSIPRPGVVADDGSGPHSPRTLPEAKFSRGGAQGTPAFRATPVRRPTPGPPEVVTVSAPPEESSQPHVAVAELTEPFSLSSRQPDAEPGPPERRSTGTAPGRTTRPFARDPHAPVFRKLVRAARDAGASDLHIVAGRPPLLRVVGQVVARGDPLEPQLVEDMMVSRVPSRLAATLEREGSCDFALEEPELGRFRVNVSRQRTGIKASMRLISADLPTLPTLGLPDAIAAATRHHQGLIVLTGPTGHGKTATLAALIDILNRETTRHIITVEDPIEHVHPRKKALMSQREVGTHTRSWATALAAALREDPDVIVVGELRDTETVRTALSASEAGHLVIGTMNTPSAAKSIDRIIDLFPPADQQQVRITLAGGLRLVVSQRLLPDVDGLRMVAAAEVLPGMVPLWNLIRDGRTYQIPSLQQRGKAFGVIRLDDSLADLVRAGRVTPATALAVAESPDELESTLGIRRQAQARPPDPKQSDPQMQPAGKGGFLERAGALFGGKKGS